MLSAFEVFSRFSSQQCPGVVLSAVSCTFVSTSHSYHHHFKATNFERKLTTTNWQDSNILVFDGYNLERNRLGGSLRSRQFSLKCNPAYSRNLMIWLIGFVVYCCCHFWYMGKVLSKAVQQYSRVFVFAHKLHAPSCLRQFRSYQIWKTHKFGFVGNKFKFRSVDLGEKMTKCPHFRSD